MKHLIIFFLATCCAFSCKNKQSCESLTTFTDAASAYEILQDVEFSLEKSHTFLSTEIFTTAEYKSCNSEDGFLILMERSTGNPYIHQKVPMSVWLGLLQDARKSDFYNVKIRGKFPLRKPGIDYDTPKQINFTTKPFQESSN